MDTLFNHASSVMTVISFITFLGILGWTFSRKRTADFTEAAQLPFANDGNNHNNRNDCNNGNAVNTGRHATEVHHG